MLDKILFVGDVHNHIYMFEDIDRLNKKYNFDRIIFVGDYIDDWFTDNHDSIKTLNRVIELKRSNAEKYTFCIGNHELSYLGYPCSGHKFELDNIIEIKLKENIEYFDLFTEITLCDKTFICSHAGFTNDYIRNILNGKDNFKNKLYDMNNNKLNNLHLLLNCSSMRGGKDNFSSFIWCDRREHLYLNAEENPILEYQIIGHSPVKEIDVTNSFIFIDTHSTYSDGSVIGDKSYLIWNENKFEVEK